MTERPGTQPGGPRARRRPRGALLVLGLMLGAVLADYLLPWPFVMTPLYVVPVLVAAHLERPPVVAATAAVATAVDVLSAWVQGLPVEVAFPYTLGLIAAGYLAVLLAAERGRTAARAAAASSRAQTSEQAHGDLQRFLGMASHDQRQPLTSLVAAVQLLRRRLDGSLGERDGALLAAIESAAQRAWRLSDDLLDAARIGTGHFAVRPTEFDLVALVREVVAVQGATTTAHTIAIDAPPRLGVVWDRDRAGQLLSNLLANAIKFSPPGRAIGVDVEPTGAGARLRVWDRGPGIGPDELPRLFQPFSRLPGGAATDGAGLGLYICAAIAEAHGGTIRVETAPGAGTTFIVELPLDATARASAGGRGPEAAAAS
jgi:signal transduction histidine kinase